jgi:hypothetical protein
MARKKAKEKLEEVADQTGYPEAKEYLQRLVADSDLRDSLNRAVDASRRASDRVGKARKPGKLLDDKKLQEDIQEALDAFRSAATGMAEGTGKAARKGRRKGRKLFVLLLGGGLALVGSEGLRSKVLDTLFGAEEEFEYAPPPPPPAPSPAAVPPVAPKPADPESAPTESSDAEAAADSEDSPPDGAA